MKRPEILPDTIKQLESLKENSQSMISEDGSHDQIWEDDIIALDNAIEIINAYQELLENLLNDPNNEYPDINKKPGGMT